MPIQISHIRKVFPGDIQVLDDLSMTVPDGQFLALLGPSGCGKSTLLRLIAGLENHLSGNIVLSPELQKNIAYVFQDAHLLPWRTVLKNIVLPLELQGVPKPTANEKALKALKQMGIEEAADRFPNQLSGGMKMRVSIARALVTDPKLLLLDEPFAALDELTRHRLNELLRALWLERKMTVIFVTHSISEAVFLSQRTIVFSKRPGKIVHDMQINLPEQRTSAMRAEVPFAGEVQKLFKVFEQVDT